jgi:hypothetical protein
VILQSAPEEFDAELNRVVTRLRSMPLDKLDQIVEPIKSLTTELLRLCSNFGDPAPKPLPPYELRAAGEVVMVLGRDARAVARNDQQIMEIIAALTAARRELP